MRAAKKRVIRTWLAATAGAVCLAGTGAHDRAARAQDVLTISGESTNVVVNLAGHDPGQRVARVETIERLGPGLWTPVHAATGSSILFRDADAPLWPHRFYRSVRTDPPAIAPTAAWANRIDLPSDPFLSPPADGFATEVRWVKFALLMDDLTRVYFQDGNRFVFHYDFATNCLAPFAGKAPTEFDLETLYRDGQRALLGAVLVAPRRNEYAIQFVGQDRYPRQMVRFLLSLVDGAITKPAHFTALYMPAAEQSGFLREDQLYFEGRGIPVASPARWTGSSGIYSGGWAYGRLVYMASADIYPAYEAGLLLPSDILLTDVVPAEVPYVRGLISLSPSTPNSHVSLLTQSYGVPFAYLDDPDLIDLASGSSNRTVVLRLQGDPVVVACRPTTEVIDYLETLKAPPVIDLQPVAMFGGYSTNTAALTPDDICYFGGKASNFGFLRRAIPTHSRDAAAFSFDLWNDFMSQAAPSGGITLAAYIDGRLGGHTYPPDMAALADDLRHVRDIIRYECDFTPEQKAVITAALAGFDPTRKVRFRSSTNVEDTETFSGAGLYDSFSARPGQPDDVYEAIRKVYASFYNYNAYLERLRHGIDESSVGMAVLFHYNFPDADELANGVATYTTGAMLGDSASVVSQPGAVSVTNPQGSEIPEIVSLFFSRWIGVYPTLEQRSSLLVQGVDTVMDWQDDYLELGALFEAVAAEYASFYTNRSEFVLDFEYKKMRDDGLNVKQVREVPAAPAADVTPVLLDGTTRYTVFQGEYATVFDNHYLKSRWTFDTPSMILDATNRAAPWFTGTGFEYVADGAVAGMTGAMTHWPAFSHSAASAAADYRFETADTGGSVRHQLTVGLPPEETAVDDAIRLLSDSQMQYAATFPQGLPSTDYGGMITSASNFAVRLIPFDPNASTNGNLLQNRTVTSGIVSVQTQYWWPPPPVGITAGYTAPLVAFKETRITGLTTSEIVLTGYFSQTYRPGHHNFTEDFLFEPGLEPGLSAQTKLELQAANIRLILVQDNTIRLIGQDGQVRQP